MAIVLTNGKCYIAINETGGIIKTPIVEEAKIFRNVNAALRKMLKARKKCNGYYPYDTEKACRCDLEKRRKKYSKEERKIIYNKSGGRCELCGQQLLLEDLTLDHIIPLAMGGEDSMDNLQASCFACNQFKNNILPDAFMDRIVKIFSYQMEKKSDKSLKAKIIYRLVKSL